MSRRSKTAKRAPTVRQREVLSRVAEVFSLDELQASACHRYAGHTRRMASQMVARGAIEEVGAGRYRKTDQAVPSCAREVAPSTAKKTRAAKKPAAKKTRTTRKPAATKSPAPRRPSQSAEPVGSPVPLDDLPARGRRFLALVQESKRALTQAKALKAFGLKRDSAIGHIAKAVVDWAFKVGVRVPFIEGKSSGRPSWRWRGWEGLQDGDRLVTADFDTYVVLEVHRDDRVHVGDGRGGRIGPWTVGAEHAWFRPRLLDRRAEFVPVNPTAKALTDDDPRRLALYWFDVRRFGGWLDAELRRLMIAFADLNFATESDLTERLGWSVEAIDRALKRLRGLKRKGMPLPVKQSRLRGERTWEWMGLKPPEPVAEAETATSESLTVALGDWFVTEILNRFEVVEVHDDGLMSIVDRRGERHGPWRVDGPTGRAWFRPKRRGERTVLIPMNAVARAVGPAASQRLAAHWPAAAAFDHVLDGDQRRFLIAVAEAGTVRVSALNERCGWTPAQIKRLVERTVQMRETHDMPIPFEATTVDGERAWRWLDAAQVRAAKGRRWADERIARKEQAQGRHDAARTVHTFAREQLAQPMATAADVQLYIAARDRAAEVMAESPPPTIPAVDEPAAPVPDEIYGAPPHPGPAPSIPPHAHPVSTLSEVGKVRRLFVAAPDGPRWALTATGEQAQFEGAVFRDQSGQRWTAARVVNLVNLGWYAAYVDNTVPLRPRQTAPKAANAYEFRSVVHPSDGTKVHIAPDGGTVVLRAGKRWYVLRLGAGRTWTIHAGPEKFATARRAAVEATGQPPPSAEIGPLASIPRTGEIDDAGRAASAVTHRMMRKLLAVAKVGDRIDLSPLADAPVVARLAKAEVISDRWWQRKPAWTLENNGQTGTDREIGQSVGRLVTALFEPPTNEGSGFDLRWLKYRLRDHGCPVFHAMTATLRVVTCHNGGGETTVTINLKDDGWYWSRAWSGDFDGVGPFDRASAMLASLVERLPLDGAAFRATGADGVPGMAAESAADPTFVLVGCVKSKVASGPVAAQALYRGALWNLRRRYAEARGLPWAIVSAGLGVVGPDEPVEPYDKRAQDLTGEQRAAWVAQVSPALARLAGRGAVVEVIASRAYVELLAKPAQALGLTLLAPLAGKGIGERKKWLADRIAALTANDGPAAQPRSVFDVQAAMKTWTRSGTKPPVYTSPDKRVRFSKSGKRGAYRVEQSVGGRWKIVGPDHRSFAAARRAALELYDQPAATPAFRATGEVGLPGMPKGDQQTLRVDVGEPPAEVAEAGHTAWMIREAAARLNRPTRGVWVVCGTAVYPIGALPDGLELHLPVEFVDVNPAGQVEAVEADPGFLLAVEPINTAMRRYRLRLDEDQRARLLDAIRISRGEGKRGLDRGGLRRRLTSGFRRERVESGFEVWTDKHRTMSWVAPRGATNDQVIDAFFAETARRLVEDLPDGTREKAEDVLNRAFRMARRRGGPRPRLVRGPAEAPKTPKTPKPAQPKPRPPAPVAVQPSAPTREPAPTPTAPKTPEGFELIAGRHTRDGHDIWTVRLIERLPRERYKALTVLAKQAADPDSPVPSGYFSRYRRGGAVPGFVFGSEAEARRFLAAVNGSADTPFRATGSDGLPGMASGGAESEWPEAPETPAARTRGNILAVQLAHALERSGTTPTAAQVQRMRQYSGWGGLSIDKVRDDWPAGIPLPNKRALVHEYYTPWKVCADITAAVRRLVKPGAIQALEPSAGVGRFVHVAGFPDWQWTAVELAPLSALILRQTATPSTAVHVGSFESWVQANPDARFDVIVSNPPYGPRGEQITEDKDRRFRVKAAYQYFILRGMALLRPGGVGAFLVPGGFLTGSSNGKLRRRVDERADLLAAFRLPSGLFPGARLTLDVVFLRARSGAKASPDDLFVSGRYFDDHPSHVLGEVKPSGRWGGEEVIGEYAGLPDFTPRVVDEAEPPADTPMPSVDAYADAIATPSFRTLRALMRDVDEAHNRGKRFQGGAVPLTDADGWRAAVEDIVRSPRTKKVRRELLREALEGLKATIRKAQRYEQTGQFERDGLTREMVWDYVARLRRGRDAVVAGNDRIQAQRGRRKARKVDVRAPQFGARLAHMQRPPLADLVSVHEWGAMVLGDDPVRAHLPDLEQAGFLRVVAVSPKAVHLRLTDAGRKVLRETPRSVRPVDDRPDALRGYEPDGTMAWESSVADFCASNAEDRHLCAKVQALAPGASLDVGGGAAPALQLRRRPAKGWPARPSRASTPVVEAEVVRSTPGLLGRAMHGLDWSTPQEVFAELVADGIHPSEAAQAVATAHMEKTGGGPGDVKRFAEALRFEMAQPVEPVQSGGEPTVPPGRGVFAWRAGSSDVIPLFDASTLQPQALNLDGAMQVLAGFHRGPWVIEVREAYPAPHMVTERVQEAFERHARRHGVEVAEVRFGVSERDDRGLLPPVEPIALPAPKMPPIDESRPRQSKAAAQRRAVRFAGTQKTAPLLTTVWHTQGRAIGRSMVRLVEIPTDHRGEQQWLDRKGKLAEGWPTADQNMTVDLLQRIEEMEPAVVATADVKALRDALLNKALTSDPIWRVHDGQLYVEPGSAANKRLQRHIGPARGANLLTKLDRAYLRPMFAKAKGSVTVRVLGRDTERGIEWGNHLLVLDRADGERHMVAPMRFSDVEQLVEVAGRPIISRRSIESDDEGPAKPQPKKTLAPGFANLEMDSGRAWKPRKPRKAGLPAGLRDVEMERQVAPDLAAAIERAKFFTDPNDPVLRGIRVGGGLVLATDGQNLIELAHGAEDDPMRVVDPDGRALDVDYPDPAELLRPADPVATVDPAPLGALFNRLRKMTTSPAALEVDGVRLLLDGTLLRGARVAPGSASGQWSFELPRLRMALNGARTGRLLLGAGTAPTVIERADGERHLIAPVADPSCAVCLPTEPDPPPAPPKGPDEGQLAAVLSQRVAQYEASDTTRRMMLHAELAGALDAFAEIFGRRLATLEAPVGIPELALDVSDARQLLTMHPAGVPLDRVANVDDLLRRGWRLDANRLLPRDDYLSGNLWTRLDRLEALPSNYRHVADSQRKELEDAIGDVSFADIADRISLRDGWLPLGVIGAFLGSFRRGEKTPVAIDRKDGVVQFRGEKYSYDDITDRFANTSSIRLILGYINHDEYVFRPKKPKSEDINKVRRAKADEFERRFKAFLSTRPDIRDRVAEAYRRAHRGFVQRRYSGDPLRLARWGAQITPHPHQNAGARRAVDQRGMVAAYGVGVGKTFTACATVALARQNVGTRRPVILVPNSLVSKWQRDIHKALPDYAVVTIGEKATPGRHGGLKYGPDNKDDREVKWRRFAAGLYDLALVTPAAFMRTGITADEFERLAAGATELQRSVRLAQRTARNRTNPSERQQALLEQGVRAFLAQMMELPPSWKADDIRWSELGVDLLIVDEAQNYKGLHSPENREGSIPRFMGQSSASKRAWNLDARARDVRARDGFVVLLSATPAKNSPLELYNLWSYVNGELWRDHGIHDPEAFISRFLTIEPRLVIDATMEASERPAVTGFQRLDELKAILLRWGEFIQPPDIGLEVPEPTTELVEVDMDEAQEDKYETYVTRIEAELDAMRRGDKSNKVLGLLARMGLVAVHAEMDRGLDYKSAQGYRPNSPKFDAIADYIAGNTFCGHIVFLQAIAGHRWLKETLVKRGLKASRIGVLNGQLAKSSDARQRIADRFNEGKLDVVIANSIAYEGLDLQTRTCAIHHADLPWEPATLNQRNGRAVRQGNTLSTVAIRYYFSRRSMDGLRFNLIQGKQGWMGALLEGSDAIANPGADLELGPDEVLLLISRTPDETRKRLDKLRAAAEAKRRADEAARAIKLLESGASQLVEARDAVDPERAERLLAGADAAFDAVARIDRDIWPWAGLLAAARKAGAHDILARQGTPPLFPGSWLRWDDDWYEVGRFGWQGTHRMIWLRLAGDASWEGHKVANVARDKTDDDVSPTRPADVADNWTDGVERLVKSTIANPYRGWQAMGWSHAAPAWLETAWPRVEATAKAEIASIRASYFGSNYGPAETRFPFDLNGEVYIHRRGGKPPEGAVLLPPTQAGWARWLRLAANDEHKYALRDDTSKWWWGRPLRPGMQRTRTNPSHRRPQSRAMAPDPYGDGMQLPPQTPIGSYLVLGIDHAQRLVWLDQTRRMSAAQALQKKVPPDIPLVVIVKVENNGMGPTRHRKLVGGDAVHVRATELVQDAGIVIAADGTNAVAAVLTARDLTGAYAANERRVPAGVPRTVIGTVRHRYRSAS